jgi:hypothetical protein
VLKVVDEGNEDLIPFVVRMLTLSLSTMANLQPSGVREHLEAQLTGICTPNASEGRKLNVLWNKYLLERGSNVRGRLVDFKVFDDGPHAFYRSRSFYQAQRVSLDISKCYEYTWEPEVMITNIPHSFQFVDWIKSDIQRCVVGKNGTRVMLIQKILHVQALRRLQIRGALERAGVRASLLEKEAFAQCEPFAVLRLSQEESNIFQNETTEQRKKHMAKNFNDCQKRARADVHSSTRKNSGFCYSGECAGNFTDAKYCKVYLYRNKRGDVFVGLNKSDTTELGAGYHKKPGAQSLSTVAKLN